MHSFTTSEIGDDRGNPRPPDTVTPLLRVRLGLDKLRALSPEERTLLFLLGSAANQIAMLTRLVIFSSNEDTSEEPEQKLSAAQTQMLVRLAIGVLAETWELIRPRYVERPIGREYTPLLDAAGQMALTTLKQHFGKSNLLHRLRNSIIFHQPVTEDVEAAFEVAASDPEWLDDWNVYLARSHLNAFYFASDVVVLHAIKAVSGAPDLVSAQRKIMDEVRLVSDAMIEFIYAFFAAIWLKHFGSVMPMEVCTNLDTAPELFEFRLPALVKVEPLVNDET
jgi:hypothetical protein